MKSRVLTWVVAALAAITIVGIAVSWWVLHSVLVID